MIINVVTKANYPTQDGRSVEDFYKAETPAHIMAMLIAWDLKGLEPVKEGWAFYKSMNQLSAHYGDNLKTPEPIAVPVVVWPLESYYKTAPLGCPTPTAYSFIRHPENCCQHCGNKNFYEDLWTTGTCGFCGSM